MNPDIARAMAEEIAQVRHSPESPERLVARVGILLDPEAPIRYKNFSSTIDGFGDSLAAGFNEDEVRRNFTEVIRLHLLNYWMTAQGSRVASNRSSCSACTESSTFSTAADLDSGWIGASTNWPPACGA